MTSWPTPLESSSSFFLTFLRIAQDAGISLQQLCRETGLAPGQIHDWRWTSPPVDALNLALQELGYQLTIVQMPTGVQPDNFTPRERQILAALVDGPQQIDDIIMLTGIPNVNTLKAWVHKLRHKSGLKIRTKAGWVLIEK